MGFLFWFCVKATVTIFKVVHKITFSHDSSVILKKSSKEPLMTHKKIEIRVTEEFYQRALELAKEQTGGNVSQLIRNLVNKHYGA